MSDIPAAGFFSTATSPTQGAGKQALDDILKVLRESLGGAAESELTIATGSITPTGAQHSVDTEADAATDDLANIATTNHPEGRIIILRLQDAAHKVVVKHQAGGAGQITLIDGADLTLEKTDRTLWLKRVGTDWQEIHKTPVWATQAEAEAGLISSKVMSPLRTAQAIAALAAGSDQTARDMAASALAYGMAQNDSVSILGSIGAFLLSDDYETDSLGTKTGADYDPSGDSYNSAPVVNTEGTFALSTSTSRAIGDLTAGWANERRHAGLRLTNTDAGVVSSAKITVAGVTTAFNSVLRVYTDSSGSPGTQVGGDSDAVNLNSTGDKTYTWSSNAPSLSAATLYWYIIVDTTADGTGSISVEVTSSGGASFHSGVDLTITSIADNSNSIPPVGEDFKMEVIIAATSFEDMTLAPGNVTIITGAQDVVGYFVFDPQEAVTYGTDIIGKLSIDGGTTKATGTWTKVGEINGQEVYRLEADVSAQTGTSLTYEITTANNKEVQYHDCVGLIPLY